MTPVAAVIDEPIPMRSEIVIVPPRQPFRLRPIMRQGTASSIPETWERCGTLEDARKAAKQMYHDDRVLRVFIVTDGLPAQFVEWVER